MTLVLALAAALAIPAFGAGGALLVDGLIAPIASNSSDHYQITADVKAIDADACVLVPVRAVSEALGSEVSWNQDKTITIDNGVMHAKLTIGKDSYIVVTSNSELVGMSTPFSLGAAPILINGVA